VVYLGLILTVLFSGSPAPEPGKASGTVTVDGTATPLTFAVRTSRENSFDSLATDTVIVLSDRAISAQDASNENALLERAGRGELVAMAVRFDGRPGRGRLFNVAVFHKGLTEILLLPDVVFEYTYKGGIGTLKMEAREFRGHTYAADTEFAVLVPPETTAAPVAPASAGLGPLPPPSKTDADRKAATVLLIQALMEGDERRSLEIIKLGVDPNGRDQKMGIPVLNWSVLMCQPPVVKALIDAKADLHYERAPGMTIIAEAVACPEAAKLLRAAGAR
jgi:hypothetical protein